MACFKNNRNINLISHGEIHGQQVLMTIISNLLHYYSAHRFMTIIIMVTLYVQKIPGEPIYGPWSNNPFGTPVDRQVRIRFQCGHTRVVLESESHSIHKCLLCGAHRSQGRSPYM